MVFKRNVVNGSRYLDFQKLLINFIVGFILVLRNSVFLILFPYKTLRKISLSGDLYQTIIIFLFIWLYFKFVYFLKNKPFPATLVFFVFLINFFFIL